MDKEITISLEFGKKPPQELEVLLYKGYREAYHIDIKGGRKITYAKHMIGNVEEHADVVKGRKRMLYLEKMPPKDMIDEGFGLHNIELTVGRKGDKLSGTYGLCSGRKLFVEGKETEKKRSGGKKGSKT